jgi:hypothetical protein
MANNPNCRAQVYFNFYYQKLTNTLEYISSILNISMSILLLSLIALEIFLMSRGLFDEDTAIMYMNFEKSNINCLLSAVPIFMTFLNIQHPNIVALRYFRLFTGMVLGASLFIVFSFWLKKKIGIRQGYLNQLVFLLFLILGSTQYPFQIISWPFGHHDFLLWGAIIILELYMLNNVCTFINYSLILFFIGGSLSGLLFFVKPSTFIFHLLFVFFYILFTRVSAKAKIKKISAYIMGYVSFGLLYFTAIQNIHAWLAMVQYGLDRMGALSVALNSYTLSVSVLDRVLSYYNDLICFYNSLTFIFDCIAPTSKLIFITFTLMCCSLLVSCIKKTTTGTTKTTSITSRSTIKKIIFLYMLVVYAIMSIDCVYFYHSYLTNKSSFNANPVCFCFFYFLFSFICIMYFKTYLAPVDIKETPFSMLKSPLSKFCAFNFFVILGSHVGSNQSLISYSDEYFYIFILNIYIIFIEITHTFKVKSYVNTSFLIFFLPIFTVLLHDHLLMIHSTYGDIDNTFNYTEKINISRAKFLLVDPVTKYDITALSVALNTYTNFQPHDLFLSVGGVVAETYLLNGDLLLNDNTYNIKYVLSSHYISSVGKIHGNSIRDTFVLVKTSNATDLAEISKFFSNFSIRFPENYTLLCKTHLPDTATEILLYSPNGRLLNAPTSQPEFVF